MKKSVFKTWFEQQFGKRPSVRSVQDLVGEVSALHENYMRSARALSDCIEWDRNFDVALKAWNARKTKTYEQLYKGETK